MKKLSGKTEKLIVRMSLEEMGNVRKTALEAGMDVSEFVRLCLAAEIARKTVSPEAMKQLTDLFRDGMEKWVQSAVDHEVAKAKAREKKTG
jgi:hypothetical protein